jgi:hypothetical protein
MAGTADEKPRGREETRANVRALYVSQLEAAGAARAEALRAADDQLDRIARVLPEALKGGLSVTEVARITGVSRQTLYQLRARYGESHRHLRLGVLYAVGHTNGSLKAVGRSLGRSEGELWPVLTDFLDAGVLELEPLEEDEHGPQPAFRMTEKAEILMDVWHEEEDEAAERESA